jgi:hypothetical protein
LTGGVAPWNGSPDKAVIPSSRNLLEVRQVFRRDSLVYACNRYRLSWILVLV